MRRTQADVRARRGEAARAAAPRPSSATQKAGLDNCWSALALLALLLSAPPRAAAQPEWPNLQQAVQGLSNASELLTSVSAGVMETLQNPNTQVVLLLPTNGALGRTGLSAVRASQIIPFLIIPVQNAGQELPLVDGVVLPTLLSTGTATVISNLTLRVLSDPTKVYVGGLPPGAILNPLRSWTAGKSRVYLVDAWLLPPDISARDNAPSAGGQLLGLTVAGALRATDQSVLGSFLELIDADPYFKPFMSNVDWAGTLFLPTNAAVGRLLERLNTTLGAFKGTPEARALVQGHVLPDRPWHTARLPVGASALPALGPDGAYLAVTAADVGLASPVVTLGGAGNVVPLTITQPNLLAGKSVVHVVSDVILTSPLPATPAPPGAGEGSGAPPLARPPPLASAPGGSIAEAPPLPADVAPSPSPSPASGAPNATPSSNSSSSSSPSGAVIAGIVVGVVFGVAAIAVAAALFYRRRRQHQQLDDGDSSVRPATTAAPVRPSAAAAAAYVKGGAASGRSKPDTMPSSSGSGHINTSAVASSPPHDSPVLPVPPRVGLGGRAASGARSMMALGGQAAGSASRPVLRVQGFIYGDPFVRTTAPQYSWTDIPADAVVPGVEVGVNAKHLDKHAADDTGSSPVVRLSRADVVKQIRLLRNGLLGRGSSALVFKCQWPGRFGPNALLAIKVLKDPYEADPAVYESFCYEAAVLATVKHQNVVRMFGYCLELPTACIIMELLPSTLKDKMYKRLPEGALSTVSSTTTTTTTTNLGRAAHTSPLVPLGGGPLPAAPESSSAASQYAAAAVQLSNASETQAPPPAAAATAASRAEATTAQHAEEPHIILHVMPHAIAREGSSAGLPPPPSTPSQHNDCEQQRTATPDQVSRAQVVRMHPPPPPQQLEAVRSPLRAREATVQHNRLSVPEVLRISVDIASGLAYLHKRPAVVSLPPHPTLMLELPQPQASVTPPVSNLRPAPRGAQDAGGDEGRKEEEEDEAKAIARIVHRDLKPSNVLIGSTGTAKISDFGLARWHNNTTVHTGKLGVGTLRYMAPELLLGHGYGGPVEVQAVTNRVDIYSLGMLIWEMASGQLPWSDLADAQIIAAVIARQRPSVDGPPVEIAEPAVDVASSSGLSALMRSLAASQGRAGLTLSQQQAEAEAYAELQAVILACLQQRDAKRPTARVVQRALAGLLSKHVPGAANNRPSASGGS